MLPDGISIADLKCIDFAGLFSLCYVDSIVKSDGYLDFPSDRYS